MAVYVSLAVECDTQEAAALVERHFRDFAIKVGSRSVPFARIDVIPKNGRWYLAADPAGMMSNGGGYVEELHTPQSVAVIQESLYQHLRGVSGFRRALFDAEAYDSLACWEGYWHGDTVCTDMIVAEGIVSTLGAGQKLLPFSPGYVRIAADEPRSA
jgi:hypothetical protein